MAFPLLRKLLLWPCLQLQTHRFCHQLPGLCLAVLMIAAPSADAQQPDLSANTSPAFADLMQQAEPALWWRFETSDFAEHVTGIPIAETQGQPQISATGPAAPDFPLFPQFNSALHLDGRSWLVVDDPGDDSVFDFTTGDSLSIEAWVRVASVAENAQTYVIGKGRLQRKGFAADNQGFALRIRGIGGHAHPSLLFHSPGPDGEFHRWNSDRGFAADGQWHHVAVSFTFGDADSGRAWVDGVASSGQWDMGKDRADQPPIADNDQVWIGSSRGNSFQGGIDELALFRRRLTDAEIQQRFQSTLKPIALTELPNSDLPPGVIVCDIREGVRSQDPWDRDGTQITMQWQQTEAAVPQVPKKYSRGAIIVDRSTPYLLRLRCRTAIADGAWQLLARARSESRLLIDGEVVADMPAMQRNASGHEQVPELADPVHESMHPLPPGDQEVLQTVEFNGSDLHLIEFETVVGGNGVRLEAGETLLAVARAGSEFALLSAASLMPDASDNMAAIGLDEFSFRQYVAAQQRFIRDIEQQERQRQDEATGRYWDERHRIARTLLPTVGLSPLESSDQLDQLLAADLEQHNLSQSPAIDDLTFLKRLTLSTVGIIPSRAEIDWFQSLPEATRRAQAIDRFLADDRWADHWVSYWQDVLAENPGILKPELNNTGPFRWWIYESFLDNKPTDRFATELTLMQGSPLGGAAAGFAMATQNDVPMAAKALVLSTAFNARNMTCSRCHDSPVREFRQEQLFQAAALLNRGPLTIPETSSVPVGPNGERPAAITVSIEPGATIAPEWPFQPPETRSAVLPEAALARNPDDPREQFALHLTHPTQSPFAAVMVNRLWARLFGAGLVSSLDDWSVDGPDNQELLQGLAASHISDGYDLKATARLILNTAAWQSAAVPADSPLAELSAAPVKQPLTAEQLVDSLYAAVGKDFGAEKLTLDPEGRRPASTFLNLGVPDRAWQFCSLSNERDRPALALPVAQGLVDLLSVYGWRESRPHAVTQREQAATVLQPLTLANGNAGHRLTQLSDSAMTTQLCLDAESPRQLVTDLFLQLLTREPSPVELESFSAELNPGFQQRLVAGAAPTKPRINRNAVSWSNHLNAEATRIKMQLEEAARQGDIPTERLTAEWRQRAEDVIWVLLNSPEMAFVP